ncbi:glycosyltransferase family 2 protein [Hymenobacter sp. BT507]|uniref:Glycosyltransferase family 2 protein n=1 Tax=Hymenobacter citatus TaxID=2763506 RepID=A0ABR7MKN8_9BACT|nr:glycosyltransferase [Hymenobacter citatus]MBC6611656.1 glycosyltransferase family 2 protein [Hymenobacter citatus]
MSLSDTKYPAGISVIICCYNSGKRLPETLEHLANQQFSKYPNLAWEVIIVDNASTDATSHIAVTEWSKYNSPAPMRVLLQPIPGTGHAREMGMANVRHAFLLFCDDDNWLNPNYLDLAYDIMIQNKNIAGLGGCGIAVCETPPPLWFESLQAAYAVGGQGPNPSGPVSLERGFVYTAGAIFRKSAIDAILSNGFQKLLSGRTAKSLGAGEDVELCYAIILSGGEIHYDERLQFQHFMPTGRINWNYFKRLNNSFGITFPFLTPYKLLMLKQTNRFKKGIHWLYISAVYLIIKDIFSLFTSLFKGNYHRTRADFSNHFGFLTSLLQNHSKVKQIYRNLPKQQWISPEFKKEIH